MALIKAARHHRAINGLELIKLRGERSQEWLAGRVCEIMERDGLARQYIAQIEGPGEDKDYWHDIPADMASAIEQAFRK